VVSYCCVSNVQSGEPRPHAAELFGGRDMRAKCCRKRGRLAGLGLTCSDEPTKPRHPCIDGAIAALPGLATCRRGRPQVRLTKHTGRRRYRRVRNPYALEPKLRFAS